ncbi:ribokinase [Lactiplantibacillus pentosus]|uniref:Ribokinase n=1 Tax=Lactiplantibacillus pentosus TaxID=1589 RepID=A0AB37RF57_LACPE|nr:ribokinase [Lactiplantibacillus pentosus]RMW42425.1 ribokinase [Lactiplantibacillus pentosus]RMW48405.1 ribokinase [Lactiplantibacillus pentosus]RMW52542.1 ribokinase [Lactiplantibacillus pentosus]RMW55276.1 ribokinase [Lactiplantibacillus pentosus]
MNTVTVIGSINLDRTIRVKNMPKPGETIHTKEIFSAGGGKGANQAVAAQRSGAKTHFIGAVGDDDAGKTMLDLLTQEKINLAGITKMTKQSTGQAYVTVDDAGENQIMIHGGANMTFTPDDVAAHRDIIEASDFVVAQFESAVDSTVEAFKIAQAAGVKTILNPAPAMEKVPAELLVVTDMIVPNETETETLTGIAITDEASMMKASAALHELGISAVIITIGSKGAFYDINGRHGVIPAFKVEAVDTTSAGDTFIGAMSSVLDKDFSNLEDAIRYGNRASSIAVQRFGAQPSIPYKNEITAAEGK